MKNVVLYQFTPREDFFSEDTRSQYCAGLRYTVHEPDPAVAKDDVQGQALNAMRVKLKGLADAWIKSEKCAYWNGEGAPEQKGPAANSATVTGKGEVK
jgi:hypothetical protein